MPLPSTEQDTDPSLSFRSTPLRPTGWARRCYVRADSIPALGHPASPANQPEFLHGHRLHVIRGQLASALPQPICPVDNDPGADLFDSGSTLPAPPARGQSPLITVPHRVLIGGADPQRSSSPLKRRASSMDPDQESPADGPHEDVDMTAPPEADGEEKYSAKQQGSASKTSGSTSGAQHVEAGTTSSPEKDAHPTADTSTTSTVAGSSPETMPELPPIEEQVKTIETSSRPSGERATQVGDEVYLVSRKWLSRAQSWAAIKSRRRRRLSTNH